MRAVIYARVSKDRKKQQKSVSEQLDECHLACAALGWEIVETYVDNHRSASRYATKDRPGYAELREHLATNPVDVLVMWESSRGSRELEDWAGLLNLCRGRGILVHIVDHDRTYNLEVPRDWKTLAEDGVANSFASDETRQRVLRNVRAQAAAGLPHGKRSYGYSRRYDDRGVLVEQFVVPEQAAVIKEAARRVLDGESCYAVAQDFNARGLPSPGQAKWIGIEVKRQLLNPRYIGKRVLRGQIVGDAQWPAILTEPDHYQLVQLLTDPARRTVENPQVTHLLTGLARCAECGGRMRPQKNRSIRGYMCRANWCVSVKVEWLEDFVERTMIHRLSQPDAAEAFAARRDDVALRAAADAEAKTLEARLKGFVLEGARGRISPASLAEIEAELKPLIEAAKLRARPRPVSPVIAELTAPGVDVAAKWATLTILQKREAVHAVIAELKVSRGRPGCRSFDPARLDYSRWLNGECTWGELRASTCDEAATP